MSSNGLIAERYFETADKLMKYLALSSGNWCNQKGVCNWIFRGVNDTGHGLIPSLYRELAYKDYLPRALFYPDGYDVPDLSKAIENIVDVEIKQLDEAAKSKWLNIIYAKFAELNLVETFIHECNTAGLSVPSLRLFSTLELPPKTDPPLKKLLKQYTVLETSFATLYEVHFGCNPQTKQAAAS